MQIPGITNNNYMEETYICFLRVYMKSFGSLNEFKFTQTKQEMIDDNKKYLSTLGEVIA